MILLAEKRDYYEVLGVSKDAGEDDIKKAYRRLAKKYHPDLNPGDKSAEDKLKEVNEAYEVLSNPEKKARYDQYGHAGVDPNFNPNQGFSGGGMDFGDFGDIFSNLGDIFGFGGGGSSRRNGPVRGRDIDIRMRLTFEEAAKGCKKQVDAPRVEPCPDCGGTGAKKGTRPETCPQCHGTGTVKTTARTPFGMMSSAHACDRCGGTGRIVREPCTGCRGTGYVRRPHKIEVTVPAGVDEGQVLSLHGQGDSGRAGGPAGDLNIVISVAPHPLFTRKGYDVWCEIPVTFTQAALGSDLTVPTLDGRIVYHMPAGTQPGEAFRLRGKGIQVMGRSGRGDQYVRVQVEIPRNLTENQKELLRQFDGTATDGRNYEKRRSFFDKLKNAMNK